MSKDRAATAALAPYAQPFELPDSFMLGTATSGLQIEGGDKNNSWYDWARKGGVTDGSSPVTANDHWNRTQSDIELVTNLGVQTHRMGIEWSRIEPEPGRYDARALDHYRDEIAILRDAGIRPLVTLHHFTNPLWLEQRGGWMRTETSDRFVRYVDFVVAGLSDLVTDWVTINEPNVYLLEGYVFGEWPPGHTRLRDYLRGSRTMIAAHEAAYETIHRRASGDALVGVAHHIRDFQAGRGLLSPLVTRVWDTLFHARFVDSTSLHADFLGVNYYTRDIVRAVLKPGELFGVREVPDHALTNDLDWEIYPPGLYNVVRRIYRRHQLPVFITENGICDRRDLHRAQFIYDHLRQVKRLTDEGIPVQRYYHWTLMDNFEWALGETAAFGLYDCNFDTQERRLRRSGSFYSEVCRSRGVSLHAIADFLDPSGRGATT